MKKGIQILILLITCYQANSQTLSWTKSTGQSNALATDNFGSVITVGKFSGTLDLDPGIGTNNITAIGPYDMYIQKLDSNGNFLWGYSFGTVANNYQDEFTDVAVDINNNIYAVGSFGGSVDFDPGSGITIINNGSLYNSGGVIVKFNQSGIFQFAYGLTNQNSNSHFGGIAIKNNNIYLTGTFTGTQDFDFSSTNIFNMSSNSWQSNSYTFNTFISKMDLSCNLVWAKQLRTKGYSYPGKIAVDNNFNVIVVGHFEDSIDLNPSTNNLLVTSNSFSYDSYVLKLDSTGNFQWAKSFGGASTEISKGLCADNSNDYYISGTFDNTVDFDPNVGIYNLTSTGGWNSYLLKLNTNGNFNWCKSGINYTDANNARFKNNLIYVGGINNAFNTSGIAQYPINLFPLSSDFSTRNNNIYLTGNSIVNKYSLCSNTSNSISVTNCNNVNVNGVIYTTSGTYTQTLVNAVGCDSILTINAIVKQPSSHSISVINCNNVNVNGVIYTTSGTYTQTLVNAVGCDSILTINAIVKQPSSHSISVTNCNNVNVNGVIYTSSGTYTQTLVNAVGCDSILTINAIVKQPSSHSISVTNCNNVNVNGVIYTSSGTYTQTLVNAVGCDSILTINAIVKQPSSHSISVTNCNNVNVNGVIYTSSGTYTQTLINAVGCDSILTINAIVKQPSSHSISVTNCNNVNVNGVIYTTSGTYTQTLINAVGCDSVLTINAIVTIINTSIMVNGNILSSNELNATYQWVKCNPFTIITSAINQQYTVINNGDYAVIITHNGCTDTSNCIKLTNLSIK
jgi:hypothetical protein